MASDYLVKGLLPDAGLVVVWGPPKCGKSFWVLDLLMHVALGCEYRDNRVNQGAVIYCALEGQKGFRRRIEAFRQENIDNPETDPPFYLMETPLNLVKDAQQLIVDIKAQAVDPDVICLDTLNRSIQGSESSDEDMTNYIRAADAIRNAFDCLVVLIHHCGHEGTRPRGHSSLMGALDVQIAVRRDGDGNIAAELELAKDSDVGTKFVSRLKPVPIFTDEDGDPVTACVVEPVEGKAADGAKTWPKSLIVFKRALEEALLSVGQTMRPRPDMPEVRAVDQEAVRAEFKRLYIPESEDGKAKDGSERATVAKNKAFLRHARSAHSRGLIGSLNVGPELAKTIFWTL